MDLVRAIKHIYPYAELDKHFDLRDDGEGVYILNWNTVDPKPTDAQLNDAWTAVILQETYDKKYTELDKACESTILGYFTSKVNGVEYQFSYDEKAQSRFNGSPYLFSTGAVTSIPWTAHKDGNRVTVELTAESFAPVAKDAFAHQLTNIAKFRTKIADLQLARSKKSITGMNAIKWEG